MSFVIMVDAGSDLPLSYLEKNNIQMVPMNFTLDGTAHIDDAGQSYAYKAFYTDLRNNVVPATSMVNVETFVERFKTILSEGNDLLVLPISAGISGTANSAALAAEEVAPLFPDRKLIVVDTLGGSLGAGIVVHYAVRLRDEGKSIDETAAWLEHGKFHIHHIVLIDDLSFLLRGGRISKSTAVLGGLIGIKPYIGVDREGKLYSSGKKRGKRAALDDMVVQMAALTTSSEIDCIAISHGDTEEEADYLIAKLKEKFKIGKVIKNYIGPLIGSHTGPGTVVLAFYGKERA